MMRFRLDGPRVSRLGPALHGGKMTVTFRGWSMTAVAAFFSILAAGTVNAQSFYDAITEVARTKVQQPSHLRSDMPPTLNPATPASAPPPIGTLPPAENPQAQPQSVTKEDGYRYQPSADENAQNWPNAEVQIARARCRFLLRHIKAEVVPLDPIKDGACGDPAPVKLVSVGTKPKVTFDPPALVNCDMVQSLHDWIIKDLQPLARRHLKSPITSVETMSSYSCRNAYGRKDTRLSEHARANAMDIRGFRTAKGKKTELIAHWGPTQRDITASKLAAAQRKAKKAEIARAAVATEAGNRQTAAASLPAREATQPEKKPDVAAAKVVVAATESDPAAPESDSDSLPRLSFRPSFLDSLGGGAQTFGVAPSRLGGPALSALKAGETADPPSWPVLLVSDRIDISKSSSPSALFLHEAHRTACRIFGTVLGPEANRAHRNHFHVDRAQRDLGNYCR